MQQDHVWHLITLYVTEEAAAAEIKELETMMLQDGDLKNSVAMLMAFWKTKGKGNGDELNAAWNKQQQLPG